MVSTLLSGVLPLIILDVSNVSHIENATQQPLSNFMTLTDPHGKVEDYRRIPSTHGILFMGPEGYSSSSDSAPSKSTATSATREATL